MRKHTGRWTRGALALAAMVTVGMTAPVPAAAQETAPESEPDCRCVDTEGEEIENCHCFRSVIPRLRAAMLEARAPRARIGVMVGGSAEADRDERGALLQEVTPGSPADEAGLRAGDVVVAVDGRSVLEPLEDGRSRPIAGGSAAVRRFVTLVGGLEPGEEVEIEYVRDGRTRTATVVPEEREWTASLFGVEPGNVRMRTRAAPDVRVFFDRDGEHLRSRRGDRPDVFLRRLPDGKAPQGAWAFGDGGEGIRLLSRTFDPCFASAGGGRTVFVSTDRCVDGVHLQELNPGLAEYFGADTGVLVTEVAEDSTLGLRAGDVILAIGDRPVESPSDIRRVLGSYETDEPVELTVVRKGEEMALRGTRR